MKNENQFHIIELRGETYFNTLDALTRLTSIIYDMLNLDEINKFVVLIDSL